MESISALFMFIVLELGCVRILLVEDEKKLAAFRRKRSREYLIVSTALIKSARGNSAAVGLDERCEVGG
jgi:hypothetical protein